MTKVGIIFRGSIEDIQKLRESLLDQGREVLSVVDATERESLVFVKQGVVISHQPERR